MGMFKREVRFETQITGSNSENNQDPEVLRIRICVPHFVAFA